MKHNKNLGENRKESQLPIKSRGCNEIQGFRGNCDSKGKLGMCPSLAESDSGGIPRRELLLEKPVFPVRQKGVPPLLLPTSMLQLPRCLVRICNLFHKGNQIANWKVSKKCNCSRENLLQNNLLRKCGLLAHTSAAFLKNCCTEKLFICLRLVLAKIMAFFTTFTQFSLTPISRNVIILMFIERTNFDEPSNKIGIFNRRNFYEKRF